MICVDTAGQAVWVPGEEGGGVVCVGWENRPRKLGFVYCLNRPSALYHINLATGKISEWKVKIVVFPSSHGDPTCISTSCSDW